VGEAVEALASRFCTLAARRTHVDDAVEAFLSQVVLEFLGRQLGERPAAAIGDHGGRLPVGAKPPGGIDVFHSVDLLLAAALPDEKLLRRTGEAPPPGAYQGF